MFQVSRLALHSTARASRPLLRHDALSGAPSRVQQSWFLSSPLTRRAIRLASSSNRPPLQQSIDKEHENKVAQEKLKARPDEVSSTSSVRRVFESTTSDDSQPNQDMTKELKHDINMVRETFRLDTVPRESHILGLSGTVPYLATSLSTVFLAWDLTKDIPTGNAFYDAILVNHDTAKYLLDAIEPLQLGYGAVIISFLGAIHWGLEYAEPKPQHDRTRFRYAIGLAAPVMAWPTLLMPIEYALTTQFAAFLTLYYVDSRATTRGWAPPWYAKYRFLLTAMVGLAIFVSLVGRAKISQGGGGGGALSKETLRTKLSEPGIADKKTDWAKLEAEERKRIKEEREEVERTKKEAAAKEKKADGKDVSKAGHKDESNAAVKDERRNNNNNGEARDEGHGDEAKDKAAQGDEDDNKRGEGDDKEKK